MNLPRHPTPEDALYDSSASRRVEAAALALHPPHTLMQRAGEAVARLARALAPHARRIWVAAGPGNNGGDGLVAATLLHRQGLEVQVTWRGDPARLPADAAWALGEAQAAGVPLTPELPSQPATSDPPDLAIDALLGLGGTRPPEGPLLAAIRHLNSLPCPRVAVDLPSGLSGDTGQCLGPEAVQATATLALLTLKPGLYTAAGRDHAGRIWLADLGVDAAGLCPPSQRLGRVTSQVAAPRRHAQHKGSFGDLWVLGGAPGMNGAALLAARAALAAGAGRVLLCLLDPAADPRDPLHPELMQRQAADWQRSGVLEAATLVCGCGGGQEVAAVLPDVVLRSRQLVLDADALNAVAADESLAAGLEARGRRGQPTVLTPHPLEAARLLGASAAQVQADRLHAAGALARRFGAVVVLKGSGTVVQAPGHPASVNPTGNARLATAGSGDVLAGWLGGLWSRLAQADASLAAAAQAAESAVWLHGRAAERGAEGGARSALPLTASRLVEALAATLTALPGH